MFSTTTKTETKIEVQGSRSKFTPLNKTSLALFTVSFIMACFMFFSHLGAMPIFSPDEALYAEPAREMLEIKEYVTTYLNYEVRYTKPPLVIWLMAASINLFGATEFASRFVGACAGAILVGMTYLFAEKFFGRKSAFIAALSLSIAPLFLAVSRLAITDAPLTLFVSCSLFSLFYGFSSGENKWKWIGHALIGLGVMTKGPVAMVIPVMVLFAYHLLMGEIKQAWSYYRPFKGLGLIALIAVPWFALEIWITKGEYFESFIMRENLQRFTGVVDHKYPWWYHIAAMFGGFFPWSLALPFAWASAFRLDLIGKKGWLTQLRDPSLPNRAAVFSTIATVSILAFFSASVSKLLPYTLPAFPFIACLVGYYLTKLADQRRFVPLTCSFLIFSLLAGSCYPFIPLLEGKMRDCPDQLIAELPAYAIALVLVGLIPLVGIWMKRYYQSIVAFAVLLMISISYFGPRLQSAMAEATEIPLVSFVQYAKLSEKPIYLCNIRKPSASWYAEKRVEHEETIEGLWNRLENENSVYIIGRARHKNIYKKNKYCKTVAVKGKFILVLFDKNEDDNKQRI